MNITSKINPTAEDFEICMNPLFRFGLGFTKDFNLFSSILKKCRSFLNSRLRKARAVSVAHVIQRDDHRIKVPQNKERKRSKQILWYRKDLIPKSYHVGRHYIIETSVLIWVLNIKVLFLPCKIIEVPTSIMILKNIIHGITVI